MLNQVQEELEAVFFTIQNNISISVTLGIPVNVNHWKWELARKWFKIQSINTFSSETWHIVIVRFYINS